MIKYRLVMIKMVDLFGRAFRLGWFSRVAQLFGYLKPDKYLKQAKIKLIYYHYLNTKWLITYPWASCFQMSNHIAKVVPGFSCPQRFSTGGLYMTGRKEGCGADRFRVKILQVYADSR